MVFAQLAAQSLQDVVEENMDYQCIQSYHETASLADTNFRTSWLPSKQIHQKIEVQRALVKRVEQDWQKLSASKAAKHAMQELRYHLQMVIISGRLFQKAD